ncbi:MAG: DUF4349 domain-containing protein [Candidatus Aenigmatarchaeota archaeon]
MKMSEIMKDKKNVAIIALCAILAVYFFGSIGAMNSPYRTDYFYAEGGQMAPSASSYETKSLGAQPTGTRTSTETLEPGSKVIQNANILLEVKDVDTAFYGLKGIASDFNGFVADSSVTESYGTKSGYVVIRVPKESFNAAVEKVKTFGTVKNEHVTADDITEEYVDLTSRLNSLKASEARLIALLDKAENVSDVMEIERELTNLRERIEALEGRIRYLDSRVDMSTITVNIREPQGITSEFNLIEVLGESASGFIDSTSFIIVAVGGLLPFAIAGGAAWFVYKRAKKAKAHAR